MISKIKNHSFISQLILLLLGLINLKLTIEIFGIEQFGLINLYISAVLFFNSILGFRVWESGIYALNDSYKNDLNLKSTFFYFIKLELLVNILLALSFVFIVYVYNILVGSDYDIYFLAFLIIFNSGKDLSNQILINLDDLRPYYYIRIAQPIFLLLLLILLYFINSNRFIIDYFNIYIISVICVSTISFLFAYNLKLKSYHNEKYIPAFNVFQFNKISYLSTTARSLWEKTDYMWVNFFATTELLGLYALAKKIVDYITLICFTYWNSLKPSFTKKINTLNGLKIIKKYQKNIFLLMFVLLVLLIFFNQLIVYFFKIENINEFNNIGSILFLGSLFWSLVLMSRYIMTLKNKLHFSLYLNIILAISFNGAILFIYYILKIHSLYSVIFSGALTGFIGYVYWMLIFKRYIYWTKQ
jgi:O-antigen/teichoic acid export membrane protein